MGLKQPNSCDEVQSSELYGHPTCVVNDLGGLCTLPSPSAPGPAFGDFIWLESAPGWRVQRRKSPGLIPYVLCCPSSMVSSTPQPLSSGNDSGL